MSRHCRCCNAKLRPGMDRVLCQVCVFALSREIADGFRAAEAREAAQADLAAEPPIPAAETPAEWRNLALWINHGKQGRA